MPGTAVELISNFIASNKAKEKGKNVWNIKLTRVLILFPPPQLGLQTIIFEEHPKHPVV